MCELLALQRPLDGSRDIKLHDPRARLGERFSIILAYLVFGELMSVAQFAGGSMVLAGIWLMQRQDKR